MAVNWHRRHKEGLSSGQRAADIMRNGMGSWPFVFSFLMAMATWAAYNLKGPNHFDPFPFILLNLLLSTLAGLQGAILLISAKRQDQISAALAQHDYETNVQAEKEIAFNNELTAEIHQLVTEVHAKLKGEDK